MKTKLFLIALFLSMGMVGCDDKDKDQIWDNKPFVVERNIKGIVFKLCLLNEQGQPATVFRKGENITFLFQITNKTGKDFYYDAYECAYTYDFFSIIDTTTGKILGKSYEALPTEDIGIVAYPFNNKDKYTFKVKWLHSEQEIVKGVDFEYRPIQRRPLKAGKYCTTFTHKFKLFGTPKNKDLEINEQIFKINFEVK